VPPDSPAGLEENDSASAAPEEVTGAEGAESVVTTLTPHDWLTHWVPSRQKSSAMQSPSLAGTGSPN